MYMYQAACWCDDCGRDICERITAEGHAPADPNDEYSYDSDDYPKYVGGSDESDSPQHCDATGDCINAIEIEPGWSIGAWLENDLTTDGEDYVMEAIREGGPVAELWAEWYDLT